MEVNCDFSICSDGQYMCIVIGAEIEEPGKVIKAFKGKHRSRKRNADVKQLIFIYGRNIEYIPRDLNKYFPNLVFLGFYGCGIKEISKQDLQGLEKLDTLWVGSSRLTSLPEDLFVDMPNLRFVSFDHNQIEAASSNLLKPLVGRIGVSVYLNGNKNIDAWYDSWYIAGSTHKSLEELMKTIDEKCIKPITSNSIAAKDNNEGIKKIWTSGQFSDFKIISRDKEFNVHRSVLAITSSEMAKIFENLKEETELKINDFTPIAVESLLYFIYTNKIIHEDNAEENYIIARKFKIQKMESAFEEILLNDLNELKKKVSEMVSKMRPNLLPVRLMEDPANIQQN